MTPLEGSIIQTKGSSAKKRLSIAFLGKICVRIGIQKWYLEGRNTKTKESRAKKIRLSIVFLRNIYVIVGI